MKKKNRILKSEEFTNFIKTKPNVRNNSFVVYYHPKKEAECRIGITLPKKIGHAVDRNKIKRPIRMMCQDLIRFDEYPCDAVIIVRFGYKTRKYDENKKLLEKLLIKAKIIDCNT